MLGWIGDIEHATLENATFRTVVFTGEHMQLTVMSIPPGEDIGREVHSDRDQFLRVEQDRPASSSRRPRNASTRRTTSKRTGR